MSWPAHIAPPNACSSKSFRQLSRLRTIRRNFFVYQRICIKIDPRRDIKHIHLSWKFEVDMRISFGIISSIDIIFLFTNGFVPKSIPAEILKLLTYLRNLKLIRSLFRKLSRLRTDGRNFLVYRRIYTNIPANKQSYPPRY